MRRKVKSVRLIPDGLKIKVLALLDDGCTSALFSYYPDELRFSEAEFVGLSVKEVLDLYHQRDMEYLRS